MPVLRFQRLYVTRTGRQGAAGVTQVGNMDSAYHYPQLAVNFSDVGRGVGPACVGLNFLSQCTEDCWSSQVSLHLLLPFRPLIVVRGDVCVVMAILLFHRNLRGQLWSSLADWVVRWVGQVLCLGSADGVGVSPHDGSGLQGFEAGECFGSRRWAYHAFGFRSFTAMRGEPYSGQGHME